MTPTRVGIGLIARDGRYLIRRRPDVAGSPLAGLWEFPGGKCLPGESPEEAAVRECLEELGLAVVLDRSRRVVVHTYPHGAVELHFFDGRPGDASAEPDPGSGFRWVAAEALTSYTFPEANAAVLRDLAGEAIATTPSS